MPYFQSLNGGKPIHDDDPREEFLRPISPASVVYPINRYLVAKDIILGIISSSVVCKNVVYSLGAYVATTINGVLRRELK